VEGKLNEKVIVAPIVNDEKISSSIGFRVDDTRPILLRIWWAINMG